MKRVLAEYHHGGLYHALTILFGQRLGWEIVRPIGDEWVKAGMWNYSQDPGVIKQYLDPGPCVSRGDGRIVWLDPAEGIYHECVQYQDFLKQPCDLVLATLSNDEEAWHTLAQNHFSKPKFARLIGNAGEPIDYDLSYNLIDTTALYPGPLGINRVEIHQEFPLDDLFVAPPPVVPKIRSFLNCMPTNEFLPVYENFKALLPEYQWYMHGINGPDGMITPHAKFADAMRDSTFVWHIKAAGEGYGHVIHNAMACGRPVITVKEMYRGKIAEKLLMDGITCIDLGAHSPEESLALIKKYSEPTINARMGRDCRAVFQRYVNFDREAEAVRLWLAKLQDKRGWRL